MLTEEEAREKILRFAERQYGNLKFPCPRCGEWTMDINPRRNALSRRVEVYICDLCGAFEALEDAMGEIKPLTSWDIAKRENWPM